MSTKVMMKITSPLKGRYESAFHSYN